MDYMYICKTYNIDGSVFLDFPLRRISQRQSQMVARKEGKYPAPNMNQTTCIITHPEIEFIDRSQNFKHLLALIKQYFYIALRTP